MPSGMMTDFAGGVQYAAYADGIPANHGRNGADGVAFDGSGNLYISDENIYNTVIRRVDLSTGLIYTVAGSGVADLQGTALQRCPRS